MAKVSIIIPLYNQQQKLLRCLSSIRQQTFTDFEIIIINDGSIDVTSDSLYKNVMNEFSSAGGNNFKYIYQANAGAPAARNRGFREAGGQYVIFCDADVVMDRSMLEKMVRVLDDNRRVAYVYSSFRFGWKKFKLWPFDKKKLKQMPYIHTSSLLRSEYFSGFDESIRRLQDWDLWLTLLERNHIGQWIPEFLFTVESGGTISHWLPSFLVKLGIGKQAKLYQQAAAIIKSKHRLK